MLSKNASKFLKLSPMQPESYANHAHHRTKKATANLELLKSVVLSCQIKRKKNTKHHKELIMDYMRDAIRGEYFSYTQEELNPVVEST